MLKPKGHLMHLTVEKVLPVVIRAAVQTLVLELLRPLIFNALQFLPHSHSSFITDCVCSCTDCHCRSSFAVMPFILLVSLGPAHTQPLGRRPRCELCALSTPHIVLATCSVQLSWAVVAATERAFWFLLLITISFQPMNVLVRVGNEGALITKKGRNTYIEILVYPMYWQNFVQSILYYVKYLIRNLS